MKRFPLIAVVITLVIIVGGVVLFSGGEKYQPLPFPPSTYEYFWGEGCPHCAVVDEFFSSWEGKDKIQIDKKEIYLNKTNASLFAERGKSCGISPDTLGVPFLVTPQGECITGDTPIIQFFEKLDLSK